MTRVVDGLAESLAAYAQTLHGGESTLARCILVMADRLRLPGEPYAVMDALAYLDAYLDAGAPDGGYRVVAQGCVTLVAAVNVGKPVAGGWLRAATSPSRPSVTRGRDSLACGTGRVLARA